MQSWVTSLRDRKIREAKGRPLHEFIDPPTGYYFIRDYDKLRVFIGPTTSEKDLNDVCDKYLNDKTGWGYWVDYNHGKDVNGALAWGNIDLSDKFLI